MAMSLTESIETPSESKTLITLSATQDTIDEEASETSEDLNVSSTSAAIVNNEENFNSSNVITYTENVTETVTITQNKNESCDETSSLPFSKVSLDKVDFIRGSHNRVKLYVLCDQRVWDDRGTGHVACLPANDDSGLWCIIVRLEANEKNVLESRILLDTIYQKQQGTLIVWSESETCDLALSFQEKTGCSEIWDRICRIQGKDPDAEEEIECDEQEPSDSSTSGISSGVCASTITLPPCDLDHLLDLKIVLSEGISVNAQREKISNAIQQNGYIPQLCDLFQICEDLEDIEKLKLLCSIAKSLFLLNNNSLLVELLDENYFKNIVGMLEYDLSFPEPRKHREFLYEKSKFCEVLPIDNEDLKAKIHQTYRGQYVLDVCLPAPSLFEENLLTVLSSHLFFNRAEIVNSLLNQKDVMKQLFDELKDPKIPSKRQRDLTNFLKELCTFSHSLQPTGPQGREQFFKALMTNDVLSTIDPCISSSLNTTRAATVELLTMIVEFNPQFFRDFLLKQFRAIPESRNDDLLINKLINHMLNDMDPEQTAANQMSQAFRILFDPESIVVKSDKTEFLSIFYKRAMFSLCKPIYENAKDGKPCRDDYYTANKLALVIDLFCFFVDHHNFSMRSYTVQKNLLSSVLVYLQSRHHLLALSALRMCRRILNLKDDLYFRYIRDRKIIDQIVNCFLSNGPRYNLLNSALIEFFEFIRTEEIKSLMLYITENFYDVFSKVDYVRTFSAMKIRCDQFDYNKTLNSSSNSVKSLDKNDEDCRLSVSPNNLQWKKEKEYDNDELFFSKDDDDEKWYKSDNKSLKISGGTDLENAENLPHRKAGVEPLFPSVTRKRKANDDDEVASIFGGNITPPITSTSQNRISKIMICVNSANENKSTTIIQRVTISSNVSNEIVDNKDNNSYNDDEESIVSSSSSSPPKIGTSTTTIPESKDQCKSNLIECNKNENKDSFYSSFTSVNSTKSSKDPIILKKGLSGLVDYDESDEDSDEENTFVIKPNETKTDQNLLNNQNASIEDVSNSNILNIECNSNGGENSLFTDNSKKVNNISELTDVKLSADENFFSKKNNEIKNISNVNDNN